jgi:hypothetical protein
MQTVKVLKRRGIMLGYGLPPTWTVALLMALGLGTALPFTVHAHAAAMRFGHRSMQHTVR